MAQKKPDTKSPEKKTQAIEQTKPKGVFDLESLSTDDAVKAITKYLCPLATEAECLMAIHICRVNELDPFLRPAEVHLIKYAMKDPLQIVVGYQKYIQRGEASGKLKGWKAWTEGEYRGKDFKACINIWRSDWGEPFYHEVYFDEYKQTTQTGALTRFWQKSRSQIIKVVISQGFRLCFSVDMSKMPYTIEEGADEEENIVEAEIVEEPTPQPKPEPELPKEEKKEEPKPQPKPEPKEKPQPKPEEEPTNGQEPEAEDLGGESEGAEEEEELTLTAEDQQPREMATEDQKKDILDKMKILVDEYKRDEEDLKKKMAGHLKKAYGTIMRPQEIPGGCDYKEAKNLIVSLDMTINSMKGEKL